MFPDLFSIGPLRIHTYGLLVALGVLAGVILAEGLFRREGGKPGRMVDMSVITVLSGLAGARAVFVLVNLDYYLAAPMEILMFWEGGLVFFGGLLGGGAAFLLASRHYGLPVMDMLDIGASGVCLGHAFGRLGCFSAGCCYGRPTGLPWAVIFTDPGCLAVEILGIPVHPTQLYSSLFLFALTVFLVWLHTRKSFPGQVAAAYLVTYGLFRFGVEFLRGDPRGVLSVLGMTLSVGQWMALAAAAAGGGMYFHLRRRRGKREESRKLKSGKGPGMGPSPPP